VLFAKLQQRLNDRARVLAPIYVIAQENQLVLIVEGPPSNHIEQFEQHRVLPVNVSDGVDQLTILQLY
jgi:hypothetical protein